MKFFSKPLFTGFSPNIRLRDVLFAMSALVCPWRWSKLYNGQDVLRVENWFKNFLNVANAFCFDSGRSALFFALQALGVGKNDEVVVQSYTCVVVVNAILRIGAKPIYVDIGKDFCMNVDDLLEKITPHTKVVIVQHTFGNASAMDKIQALAKKYNFKIIEDCAHSLGATYKKQRLGTFGDIAMFSFGSDKVVSSVRGGIATTNNQEYANLLNKFQSDLHTMPLKILIQHLLHYPIFYFGRATYNIWIGKALLASAKKVGLINKIIYNNEKKGMWNDFFPSAFPNILASIVLKQLFELENTNNHRKKIADIYSKYLSQIKAVELPIYSKNSIFLRYTFLTDKPRKLLLYAKKDGVLLGDWYSTELAPSDISNDVPAYRITGCPVSKNLSKQSVNLPTDIHIKEKDALRICKILRKFYHV